MPFSELQLHGKATAARLQHTRSQSLLIRRRSGENLVLTTAERAGRDREVSSLSTRMLAGLLNRGDRPQDLIADVLADVFPWATLLPAADQRSFTDELAETLRAADNLDNPNPLAQLVTAWRHTAEAHAEPQLAAVLAAGTNEDYGTHPDPRRVSPKRGERIPPARRPRRRVGIAFRHHRRCQGRGDAVPAGAGQHSHRLERAANTSQCADNRAAAPSAQGHAGHCAPPRCEHGSMAIRGHRRRPHLVPRRPRAPHLVGQSRHGRPPEDDRIVSACHRPDPPPSSIAAGDAIHTGKPDARRQRISRPIFAAP